MKYLRFLLTFFLCLNILHTFSQQQAQYGFFDKYYIGVLGNGIQQDYSKFSSLKLGLWCHYPIWSHTDFNRGWTDLVANDINIT